MDMYNVQCKLIVLIKFTFKHTLVQIIDVCYSLINFSMEVIKMFLFFYPYKDNVFNIVHGNDVFVITSILLLVISLILFIINKMNVNKDTKSKYILPIIFMVLGILFFCASL